jgi:secreted PhoX family phosphatase
MTSSSRRQFLQCGAALAGSAALALPLEALWARLAAGDPGDPDAGYGPLFPTTDETTGLPLVEVPRGFRYLSLGWTGDPLDDGTLTPSSHDGMAVVANMYGRVVLVRNHEITGESGAFAPQRLNWDPQGPGGTTNLVFNTRSGRLERSWASLGGTVRNCAGGATPWGSWLTCEETLDEPGTVTDGNAGSLPLALAKTHGWIFEVPALSDAAPVPIEGMGRFIHEAVAVDPRTGAVYETEDRTTAGFYRYVPNQRRLLHLGGRLQMLRAAGRDNLSNGVRVGEVFPVDWVDIADPTQAHSSGTRDRQGVYIQGKSQGGATFARLEGCTFNCGLAYIVSTSGGAAGAGQVWEYNPHSEELRLIFESPGREVLDAPDNITVSPRGGLVLCEDGQLPGQRLHGLSLAGELFPLARNNVQLSGERNGLTGDFRGSEWAGCTFSPDGRWLFANLQRPGITVAITGPWRQGPL